MTSAKKHPRVRPLHADDLCWDLAPARWPKSRPVLELAIDALGVVKEETACRIIALLATTVVDQIEELAAVRFVGSEVSTFSAAQFGQATCARRRLAERLKADRRRSR